MLTTPTDYVHHHQNRSSTHGGESHGSVPSNGDGSVHCSPPTGHERRASIPSPGASTQPPPHAACADSSSVNVPHIASGGGGFQSSAGKPPRRPLGRQLKVSIPPRSERGPGQGPTTPVMTAPPVYTDVWGTGEYDKGQAAYASGVGRFKQHSQYRSTGQWAPCSPSVPVPMTPGPTMSGGFSNSQAQGFGYAYGYGSGYLFGHGSATNAASSMAFMPFTAKYRLSLEAALGFDKETPPFSPVPLEKDSNQSLIPAAKEGRAYGEGQDQAGLHSDVAVGIDVAAGKDPKGQSDAPTSFHFQQEQEQGAMGGGCFQGQMRTDKQAGAYLMANNGNYGQGSTLMKQLERDAASMNMNMEMANMKLASMAGAQLQLHGHGGGMGMQSSFAFAGITEESLRAAQPESYED